MAGKWIVFEGLDGAGTTTQTRLLVERLQSETEAEDLVYQTAEPTQGPFGALCRRALRGEYPMNPETLALAFTADRSDHLHRPDGILPHRVKGCWIVQDRYLYSTLAYQDGVDRRWLCDLNARFPRPDLVVYLDTPIPVCLERIASRGEGLEMFEREDLLRRIAGSYEWVFEYEARRSELLRLDGSEPPEQIAERVFQRVMEAAPA